MIMKRQQGSSAWLLWVAILVIGGLGLSATADRQTLDEPFKGVTVDGNVRSNLFPIRVTGVSTAPVRAAATQFLRGLTAEQREATQFPVDDDEWRLWNNVHRYQRQGVSFREMSEPQRELAFGLLRASLSIQGFEKSRNVMRLNGHLGELIGNLDDYGDDLYWITVMGAPSETEPWGWQLDGHHLVINYFVLGDQVVMTPSFMGSEPVTATSGRYAGASVMQPEQEKGLAFIRSLDTEQRKIAVIDTAKARGNALAQAFRDNVTIPYAGILATALDSRQRDLLLDVIREYVANMDEGHANVRMDEVMAHLDETYVAWIGGTGPNSVFYYRVLSPVILIEFDHQGPIALDGPRDVATRRHVHSVVRTPNGNDYGKDLLREHYEAHRGDPAHGHVREWR